MTLTVLAWKAIESFAKARAEDARLAHGPGPVTDDGGTITLMWSAGSGTVTADAEIPGRVSWRALALLLASKVNPATLAAVVADYNAGHRPAKPTGFGVQDAINALDVGTGTRRGSIRSTEPCVAGVAPEAVTLAG